MTLYLPPCPVAGCNSFGIIGDGAPRLCWRHANEAAGVVIALSQEAPPSVPIMRTVTKPWTNREEETLRAMWARGATSREIGVALRRTGDQVSKRARHLGLRRGGS